MQVPTPSCRYPGDMAVRMRKVLARPWVGVRVCHLLLLSFYLPLTTNGLQNYQLI